MRLRALRKSARSDVGQAFDAGDLVRRASASKGSGASVPEESRPRTSLKSGGETDGVLEGPRGAVTQGIFEQIRMGRTARVISAAAGVSEVLVSTLLEHYDRPGMLDDAGLLCSLRLGTYHAKDVSDEARVACAGCPLVI